MSSNNSDESFDTLMAEARRMLVDLDIDDSEGKRLERVERDLAVSLIDQARMADQVRHLTQQTRKLADAVASDFKRVTEHLNKLIDSHNKVTAILDSAIADDADFEDLPDPVAGVVRKKSEGEGNN